MLRGNLVIVQSGGPTAVTNSSLCGIVQEALRHAEIEDIYGAVNGVLGILYENLIDLRREEPETIQKLRVTPSAALGSCRRGLNSEDFDRILALFKAHNIRYSFFIGGNGTMGFADKLSKLADKADFELGVMGIPKTIDNDIVLTDHTPGYPSVARWWAVATRDAGLDNEAIYQPDTVKVLETMGRDAGWITASTALLKEKEDDPPHLIYLPERTFDEDKFLGDVEQVYKKLRRVVIAVCEGLKDETEEYFFATKGPLYTDSFGRGQVGGVADYLCKLIAIKLKLKARCDRPGTIQRVSTTCVSKVDAEEACIVGRIAVREVILGATGYMVALRRQPGAEYRSMTCLVKLEDVAGKTKYVPENFINEEGNFVTEEFIKYAKPLIGEPLPEYARVRKFPLKRLLPPYDE